LRSCARAPTDGSLSGRVLIAAADYYIDEATIEVLQESMTPA
jgi:hypothetical protein